MLVLAGELGRATSCQYKYVRKISSFIFLEDDFNRIWIKIDRIRRVLCALQSTVRIM